MKMLDKIKNLFTEEVEVEEPIKKEVTQVEIPAPAVKVKPVEENVETESISDANISREEKFKFPVYFDDNDFNDLEPKKEVKSTIQPVKKETPVYGGNKPLEKQEKKQFKPTPIISPVYGVLDKNYHKEDIVHKPKSVIRTNENITVDDIRKKAYGTLEDDLENTLFGKNSILLSDVLEEEEKQETDMFEELMIEPVVVEETFTQEETEALEVNNIEDNFVAEAMNEEIENDNKLSDSDLFNLIDSMYEKGDSDDN